MARARKEPDGEFRAVRGAVRSATATCVDCDDRDRRAAAQISFTADSNFDTTLLRNYVTQKVGQPLSLREVQTSIKSLFSTGDFRDVRVTDAPSGNDVGEFVAAGGRVKAWITFELRRAES